MRMADFGAICLENMKKQKGKVALAALGVLVGCFLLVILISFPLRLLWISSNLAIGSVLCGGGISVWIGSGNPRHVNELNRRTKKENRPDEGIRLPGS